jgi:hypothetical protein
MKPTPSLLFVATVSTALSFAMQSQSAHAQTVAPSAAVPSAAATSAIAPPAGAKLAMKIPAIGVQIYTCKNNDAGAAVWTFVAPEADLFDEAGTKIGKHYAGPHWELDDGSKLQGKVEKREDSKRKGAIAHLLLSTTSKGGAGKLEKMKFIQRVNTIGGVAPDASNCNAQSLGKEARVYYTADYLLLTE